MKTQHGWRMWIGSTCCGGVNNLLIVYIAGYHLHRLMKLNGHLATYRSVEDVPFWWSGTDREFDFFHA